MIVWLWAAGSAVGVTDDHANARRAAVFFMRSAGTDAAVVEQAYFISGTRSLGAGYERDGAARWVARRHPGGRISWRMRPADPGAGSLNNLSLTDKATNRDVRQKCGTRQWTVPRKRCARNWRRTGST